ncbi:MAG: GNAT family N-acetyltransferase [Proteobacteria bacterium]|nr:GNAT family N-acetyltransferase [Pseudomonadota bacterium]
MSEHHNIRWAEAEDAGQIVRLIKALAAFENEPVSSVKVTEADILRDGFGKPDNAARRFECLIAECDGAPVGLCLFFHNYSTWEGRAGLYVEDLFIEEHARGLGLGRLLLAALARVAKDRNCRRIDLSVLEWNPTREFYHRINMREMEAWRPYRMDQVAIAALAIASPDIGGVG